MACAGCEVALLPNRALYAISVSDGGVAGVCTGGERMRELGDDDRKCSRVAVSTPIRTLCMLYERLVGAKWAAKVACR